MNIQSEKLALIEWIVGVDDAKVIQHIKAIKKEEGIDLFKKYTTEDLKAQVASSLDDIKHGRVMKLSQVKSEVAKWKKSKGMK